MLHLLTSQVTLRQSSTQVVTNSPTPTSSTSVRTHTQRITEDTFKLKHENSEWNTFSKHVHMVSSDNIHNDINFDKNQDPLIVKAYAKLDS